MRFDDEIKNIIDILQTKAVSELESDNVLLIFDYSCERELYKRNHKYLAPDQLLFTLEELLCKNKLDGLRYKRFHFVTDEEIEI